MTNNYTPSPRPGKLSFPKEPIPYSGGGLFNWDDNKPTPKTGHAPITKEQTQQVINSAVALPYKGEWDAESQCFIIEDPDFEGLTNLEVIAIRVVRQAASGDKKAAEQVLDRVMGKPKQSVEQVSVQVTLPDVLEEIARRNGLYDEPKTTSFKTINYEDLGI